MTTTTAAEATTTTTTTAAAAVTLVLTEVWSKKIKINKKQVKTKNNPLERTYSLLVQAEQCVTGWKAIERKVFVPCSQQMKIVIQQAS